MKDERLLTDDDLLDETHYFVIWILNGGSNSFNFICMLENFINEIGFGVNVGVCTFYSELDDYDKLDTDEYIGLEFFVYASHAEIIISYEELYHYLCLMSKKYIERYPTSEEIVNGLLQKFYITFKLSKL